MFRLFVKWCVKIFTLIVFRVKTYGQENIEKDKPYIMCANHISNWDALTIYTATKREMFVMAKEEMFVNKFVYWFGKKMNVFPVKRGKQDIESIKKSLKVLKDNKILLIFPEGTRNGMKKNGKIRSNFVKESILDYENLANSLKENTSNIVKDLLSEAIKETYTKILTESDEDEYEVEEVNDTESEETNDAENNFQNEESSEVEETSLEEPNEEVSQEEPNEGSEIETEGEDGEWAEFDKFKVSDDEYDFSQANDDEIVKVYKLLKDTDQVLVNADKESGKVEIKDNETGAEYLLDLSCMNGGSGCEASTEPMITDDSNFGEGEADDELNDSDEYMQESRFYEVVLNEYDSHVGYTDNYQKKDVMTNPGTSEPGKNVNDWDAGVPKGDSKPWAGKNGNSKPFEKKVNSELSESEEVINEEDDMIEEANLSQSRWNDTHAAHNRVPAANDDAHRRDGMQKTSKGTKYRAHGTSETNESKRVEKAIAESKAMMKKVDNILKENEELKSALTKFKTVLQEAAVTNYNLGQIVKLISENTTSKDEKKEIINRFSEAKSIEQSKQLFESISCELQKKSTMNINEEKQFTANSSKMINETQIYKSKDLLDSLDLMHRLCK